MQGCSIIELTSTTHTGVPPVGRRVNSGVSARQLLVTVHELPRPSLQLRLRHAKTGVTKRRIRVILQVEHTRQCLAISRPSAAILHENLSLSTTRRLRRQRKVVTASYKTCLTGTRIMLRESRVNIGGAFTGLHPRETATTCILSCPVDIGLVIRDVLT